MGRPGGVDAQEDLDLLDVLGGDLLERRLGDSDLVGGGVRAGVPRAQHPGEGLVGLIAIGQHRVKAEAALEVPRGAVLIGMRANERCVLIDRDPLGRYAELPHMGARLCTCRAQPLHELRIAGDPLDHPKRRRI